MVKKVIFLLLSGCIAYTACAQRAKFNLFLGFGQSIKPISHTMLNTGAAFKFLKYENLFFHVEYNYTQKQIDYTYYTENDYAYVNKRSAIILGPKYAFKLSHSLSVSAGINMAYINLKSTLNTENDRLSEILLNKHVHYEIRPGYMLHMDYWLNAKDNLYLKFNKQFNQHNIFPVSFIGLGFCKGF